jgi:hypothetical protein
VANLYSIDAEDDEGYNFSLFVRADTPEAAFEIWKQHEMGQIGSLYFEPTLSTGDAKDASEEDLRIFLIPDGDGALDWHTPTGVNCVAFAESI